MRNQENHRGTALGDIGLRSFPLGKSSNRALKRGFDLLLATLLFVSVFAWLWPVLALLIRISSPGPVFFRQERWGVGGRPFICYKFRSMVRESRDMDRRGRYQQTRRNDWRVTPLGRFLRRNNLDEFAQVINVFKGEMSFVGPRPHPSSMNLECMRLIQHYQLRHRVKPGITGWAQVNGLRGETQDLESLRRRVEHDIWYMENWSLWLDIRIVWRSITLMLRGDPRAY